MPFSPPPQITCSPPELPILANHASWKPSGSPTLCLLLHPPSGKTSRKQQKLNSTGNSRTSHHHLPQLPDPSPASLCLHACPKLSARCRVLRRQWKSPVGTSPEWSVLPLCGGNGFVGGAHICPLSSMMQKESLCQMPGGCETSSLLRLVHLWSHKVLFFINYLVLSILLQQQKWTETRL